MILIIGSNHDDVLYFHSIIRNAKEVVLRRGLLTTIGTMFNSKVMIVESVYTSYLSASLITYIIHKYFVSAVFMVGKCQAISDNLEECTIAVSNRVVFGDINQIDQVKGTVLGQIPGLPKDFYPNSQLHETLSLFFNRLANDNYFDCLFFSSNAYGHDKQLIEDIAKDEKILAKRDNIVVDGETAGVALSCYLMDIPFISVKVIEGKAGEKIDINNYVKILRQYAIVGKAVVSCIGEINRQEILR
ncbi:MAG: hypothetical protein WCR34_04615 [Bacilli bacterium]|jgi:adenosylhomocysteine nucleosidase